MLFEITFYVFFIIIIIIIIIIPCFHSRGQLLFIIHLFIGTKESVYIRKEFNSRTGLGHQHGRRFIVLGHKYGHHDVM